MSQAPRIPLRRPIINSGSHWDAAQWRRFPQDGHLFVKRQGRHEDGRKFVYWECGRCGAQKNTTGRYAGSPREFPLFFNGLQYAAGTTCAQLLVRHVLGS